MEYKIVEVEWVDAVSKRDVALQDILTAPTTAHTVRVKSVGYLIKKDKHGVIIAQDMNRNDDCDITAIPMDFNPKVREIE